MTNRFGRAPAKPRSSVILSTGLALILAFVMLIALFFIFVSIAPSITGQCVAVVDIDTELTVDGVPPSLFDAGYLGSEELGYVIGGINDRADVGAVVFVINSPGGSVVATHEVYDAVDGLNKPKVSYFREVAASGGYYVATGTDYIITDPDALTGSIGVVATSVEMSGLLDDLGVNVTTITSGKHKDIGSPFRNMTVEEQQILQGIVDEVYKEFRNIVVENRKDALDMKEFEKVSDGRILSGRQAVKVGLADETGSKKDAIMKAADLAGIEYETYDDIRVCPISTSAADNAGLMNAESIFRILMGKDGQTELRYQ